jgi:hypothetical protein
MNMNNQSDSIERWSRELQEGYQQLQFAHRRRRHEPLQFVQRYESFGRILCDFENFTKWRDESLLNTIRCYVDQIQSDYEAEKGRLAKREFWDGFYNEPRPWQGGRADGNS